MQAATAIALTISFLLARSFAEASLDCSLDKDCEANYDDNDFIPVKLLQMDMQVEHDSQHLATVKDIAPATDVDRQLDAPKLHRKRELPKTKFQRYLDSLGDLVEDTGMRIGDALNVYSFGATSSGRLEARSTSSDTGNVVIATVFLIALGLLIVTCCVAVADRYKDKSILEQREARRSSFGSPVQSKSPPESSQASRSSLAGVPPPKAASNQAFAQSTSLQRAREKLIQGHSVLPPAPQLVDSGAKFSGTPGGSASGSSPPLASPGSAPRLVDPGPGGVRRDFPRIVDPGSRTAAPLGSTSGSATDPFHGGAGSTAMPPAVSAPQDFKPVGSRGNLLVGPPPPASEMPRTVGHAFLLCSGELTCKLAVSDLKSLDTSTSQTATVPMVGVSGKPLFFLSMVKTDAGRKLEISMSQGWDAPRASLQPIKSNVAMDQQETMALTGLENQAYGILNMNQMGGSAEHIVFSKEGTTFDFQMQIRQGHGTDFLLRAEQKSDAPIGLIKMDSQYNGKFLTFAAAAGADPVLLCLTMSAVLLSSADVHQMWDK